MGMIGEISSQYLEQSFFIPMYPRKCVEVICSVSLHWLEHSRPYEQRVRWVRRVACSNIVDKLKVKI